MPQRPPLRLTARELAVWRGDHRLLAGLSFDLGPGAMLWLRGPNGAGKTSLLRVLAGLAPLDGGELDWCGMPVRTVGPSYHADVAWIGHLHGLKRGLSARENLRSDAALRHDGALRAEDIDAALADAGLSSVAGRPVEHLSAGQRRRAALARLALADARIWLLDEPHTHLDAAGVAWFGARVEAHLADGGLAVMASHQEPTAAGAGSLTMDVGARAA